MILFRLVFVLATVSSESPSTFERNRERDRKCSKSSFSNEKTRENRKKSEGRTANAAIVTFPVPFYYYSPSPPNGGAEREIRAIPPPLSCAAVASAGRNSFLLPPPRPQPPPPPVVNQREAKNDSEGGKGKKPIIPPTAPSTSGGREGRGCYCPWEEGEKRKGEKQKFLF